MNKRILCALGVLGVALLACGGQAPRKLDLYPSQTALPTQTERVVIWTQTPNATPLPVYVQITNTPNAIFVCVVAVETVYLRPAPNAQNYPVTALPNGSQLLDMGGRDGNWTFVEYNHQRGWVNSTYIENCQEQP